jgi:cell division septum initiation protein DivIVA
MDDIPDDIPQWAEMLLEEVGSLRQEVKRLRANSLPPIPEEHKYPMTNRTIETEEGEEVTYCDVGIRLQTGQRPTDLSRQELLAAAERAPSSRTIRRLTADEDAVLTSQKMGGGVYVTERSIQHYEQGLRDGWIQGYAIIDSVQQRIQS